jgi:CRISPR system Cascade subunit CasC
MSATPARFVDLHLLQTVPYANLNRDDLGSPKSLVYGGVTRTRVSSQCWKRATRLAVEADLGDPAVRTRRVVQQVAKRLRADGWSDALAVFAGQQLIESAGSSGINMEDDKVTTSVLLYLPASAIDGLADLAQANRAALEQAHASSGGKEPARTSAGGKRSRDSKATVLPTAEVQRLLGASNGIIALSGRMLAELPQTNVDGAVQVAHAFTTHATETELDFFTAVDDLNPAAETGSGHMNSLEFSAGVFYRYANVDIVDLTRNLNDDHTAARDLVAAFLRAFIGSIPTGKRTATAPQTLPDLAYATVRADRPLSLAGAFEAPVRADQIGGWSSPSRRALAEYAATMHRLWGNGGLVRAAHAAVEDKPLAGLGDAVPSFADLVDTTVQAAFPPGQAKS